VQREASGEDREDIRRHGPQPHGNGLGAVRLQPFDRRRTSLERRLDQAVLDPREKGDIAEPILGIADGLADEQVGKRALANRYL